MKNHIVVKFLAIVLATLALVCALGSILGIIVLADYNLYDETVDEVYESHMYSTRYFFALNLVHRYVSLTLGDVPVEYLDYYYGSEWLYNTFRPNTVFYSIFDSSGTMVESTVTDEIPEDASFYEIELRSVDYRLMLNSGDDTDDSGYTYSDEYFDFENDRYINVTYRIATAKDYIVHLYLLSGAYTYDAPWLALQQLWGMRFQLFWFLGIALVVFAVTFVYLCCAAGRKPGSSEIRPVGLNRLPLDLYTLCAFGLICLAVALLIDVFSYMSYESLLLPGIVLLLTAVVCSLMIVSLLYAWAAQIKTANGFWWRNTIISRCMMLVARFLKWIGRGIRTVVRSLHVVLRMMPVIWQWVLTALFMGLMPFALFMLYLYNLDYGVGEGFFLILFLLSILADIAISLYGGYCFGILMKGTQRMSHGDLKAKIPTNRLYGSFRDFALQLNTLSEAAYMAAQKQMQSERTKTELITNVSHDIKTPLTSIINFVDLLQKPHTPEQEQEYLEVLSRQSAQMKKLIEDLMELSKASTGNITINAQKMDASEALTQALGEFSDRLALANLTPVLRKPEEPVMVLADGRLVWRVLFNLLTNAVKYAMPGTRLYIDLVPLEDRVLLSLKNISREELNISAEELMERFVQGDASRNSEGSGLGLNIAKSLMEVQGGSLDLLLDGDLFKVTLILPAAR